MGITQFCRKALKPYHHTRNFFKNNKTREIKHDTLKHIPLLGTLDPVLPKILQH